MGKKRDRSKRDMAGVGPVPGETRRLVPLDHMRGFDIADGEPDIRGWDVRTVNGRELGEVDDLLIDPDRREVVMLEVELRDGGMHAEVPIRSVQLDRDRKLVLLDSADLDDRITGELRARDRISDAEIERLRSEYHASRRDVNRDDRITGDDRGTGSADEIVVERRPVIEEVVIRRRIIDEE